MRITTNNTPINPSDTVTRHPVKEKGTVLLLPTQVPKYLGSYERHKIIDIGLFLPAGYILEIVEAEMYDGVCWLLVIYNNRYYYTPIDYIDYDTSYGKVVKIEEPQPMKISKAIKYELFNATGTVSASVLNVRAGAGTNHEVLHTLNNGEKVTIMAKQANWYQISAPYYQEWVSKTYITDVQEIETNEQPEQTQQQDANKTSATRIALYNEKDYALARATGNVDFYNHPGPDREWRYTVEKGNYFVIQSVWENDETNDKFIGSTTYSPYQGAYANIGENYESWELGERNIFYHMVEKEIVEPKFLQGAGCGIKYKRGTINDVVIQDWRNGDQIKVVPGHTFSDKSKGLFTIAFRAQDVSPLADRSDLFKEKYHGTLKISSDMCAFAMHRGDKDHKEKDMYLKDISYKSLSSAVSLYINIRSACSNGTDLSMIGAGYNNVEKIPSGSTLISVNKIQVYGENCWICYKPSTAINGATNFYVILDDKTCVEFSKFPEVNDEIIPVTPDQMASDSTLNGDGSDYNLTDLSDEFANITYTLNETPKQSVTITPSTIDDSKPKPDGPWPIHLNGDDGYNDKVPGIDYSAPQTPPSYEGWPITHAAEHYNLATEKDYDHKHITHINRFKLQSPTGQLSTKSFIFVTRPDLNLYTDNPDNTVNTSAMNPDLKKMPTFKYIARLRGNDPDQRLGNNIMNSLCYYAFNDVGGPGSPWLSIITNQARGYQPVDREMDTVELAETFHGNKVIYAEPTYKYKIGGTVSIPFQERRDLSLYLTLRMWIEYIQMVSIGQCSPRACHRHRFELDYASSLFYIVTDETMENILYWEKLTGLIPLTVPDSFFSWNSDSPAKDMRYNVNFAYSFRTVMDELHFAEINNLYRQMGYLWAENATNSPAIPPVLYDRVWDLRYNENLARVAAFYGHLSDDGSVTQYDVSRAREDKSIMDKYYYGGIPDINRKVGGEWPDGNKGLTGIDGLSSTHKVKGSTDGGETGIGDAKFLPNYNIYTQSYGIPYVNGPYIEHDPDLQRYKLRWV